MKGCPLCGAEGARQLDLLGPTQFLLRQNKLEAIARLIRDVGPVGLTVWEICRVLRISHASVSARVHDLARANRIQAAGKRVTPSGRLATVWVGVDPREADTAQLAPAVAA